MRKKVAMILDQPKWMVLKKTGEKCVAFAEFNDGYSHIIVDDGCWVILNGGGMSAWIFPEAAEILKQLPSDPMDYEPYRMAVGMLE